VYFEAENAGLVPSLRFWWQHRGVDLEEDVVEGRAKVRAVDYSVTRGLGIVEVLTASAVKFYR
jgi:hypothetical protein